ncbi:MAG: hypothetical protein WC501_03420 [Candidatus Micrarchaeia archaeon]
MCPFSQQRKLGDFIDVIIDDSIMSMLTNITMFVTMSANLTL